MPLISLPKFIAKVIGSVVTTDGVERLIMVNRVVPECAALELRVSGSDDGCDPVSGVLWSVTCVPDVARTGSAPSRDVIDGTKALKALSNQT